MTIPPSSPPPEAGTVTRARAALHGHRMRARAFGPDADMFGDPAWLLLLDLHVSQADRRPVDLRSAAATAGMAASAAQRWLHLLEGRGLIRREADRDAATGGLSLTDKAIDRIRVAIG